MAKTLENAQDKIQEICDVLRKETLEPAKIEAESIIKEAHEQADRIIKEAHERGEKLLADMHKKLSQEKSVFESALEQGARQVVESLKQEIEEALFNKELHEEIEERTKDPKAVAKIIEAMIKAVEKEGVKTDLEALIPKSLKAEEVNALLAESALKKLSKKSVSIGGFDGGAELKVKGKQLTLQLTETVVKNMLSHFLRKDFRKLLFSN